MFQEAAVIDDDPELTGGGSELTAGSGLAG
jgi:hypothetical protein